MRKMISLTVIILAIIVSVRIFSDLTKRDKITISCAASDYACNYQRYMDAIERKPPDFSNAKSVAIETPVALKLNIEKSLSSHDFEATSMLRVINSYPESTKEHLCQSRTLVNKFKKRASLILSPYQRQEYERLFSELRCV